MRKFACLAILFMFSLTLLMTSTPQAYAAGTKGIDIYVNGSLLNIPPNYGVPFYDVSNRLQIPMRYIIESCGYDVVWNNADQTATVPTQNGSVVITLGSTTMTTPAGPVTMDTNAMAMDSRTYIPLRFALEALGFDVQWTYGAVADRVDITGTIGAASSRVPMTAAEVSALAAPATFYIEVSGSDNVPFAGGSGFFITSSGVGVSNYHVIEGAYYADITTIDGKSYEMGMVLYYDIERDLAIFDVLPSDPNVTTMNIPYLNLALPSSIHNGGVVYAIGSPLGLQNSITDGLVSNKDRILPGETLTYIQTSAPISHGNSGGPLLNQYGEVVGINTAMLTDGQNLNLAIPVSELSKVDYSNSDNWLFLFQVFDRENTIQPPTNIRLVRQDGDTAYIQFDPVDGADHYYFYYQKAGDPSFWYDEELGAKLKFQWYPNDSIRYNGLTSGNTYNIFITTVKNGIESRDSDVLTFTFKGSSTTVLPSATPPITIPYYSDAWWLPDFGALTGATLDYFTQDNGYYTYFYVNYENAAIYTYASALISAGYVFDQDAPIVGTEMFYHHETLDALVLTDIASEDGAYCITTKLNDLPSTSTATPPSPATPEPPSTSSYAFPFHLYSNDGRTYLGKLVTSTYDSDGIWNPYGTYGSKYSTDSIWNPYGTYGSKYSPDSAFNPYTQTPPKIVDNNDTLFGYLTENKYTVDGYSITELQRFLTNNNQ